MNIQIIENKKDLQVIIECMHVNEQITRLKSHIELFENKIQGKAKNEIHFVNAMDVLYFESVDNRTFLYTEDDVMEIKQRLYELEMFLSERDFLRISKSQIININKIRSLRPEMNRTILATMCNGEQLHISRKYVKVFKELLAI